MKEKSARYRAIWTWLYPDKGITSHNILTEDEKPKWSGLFDTDGNKLYKKSNKIKMGYIK